MEWMTPPEMDKSDLLPSPERGIQHSCPTSYNNDYNNPVPLIRINPHPTFYQTL